MHSAVRDSGWLQIGSQQTVIDDQKFVSLGIGTGAVGFVDIPSTDWVDSVCSRAGSQQSEHAGHLHYRRL
jgi:hypothetical protein